MILDKPMSIGHFGEKGQTCVIYSVDIHPDGSRFATGGGDHRVKIWSMEPFRSPPSVVLAAAAVDAGTTTAPSSSDVISPAPVAAGSDDLSSKIPSHVRGEEVKVLAVLSQHTGSVLCVRWSHDGRYLASASDDTYVLIWELRPADAASSVPFGSRDAPNVENWARVGVLRGHAMDVLDCAWSPDDSMLASCGIDNTVIVWRMPTSDGPGRAFSNHSAILTPFQTLRRHKSFVKGVAWDPLGRYVASIGEDNQLLVWRVGGKWDVEAAISEPFRNCEDTLVRRISWSPDGQFLVATNSKDGDIHRAVVLSRGRWDQTPTSLVGHAECTLTACFSPVIYRKQSAAGVTAKGDASAGGGKTTEKRPTVHHVVAVAGRDNVITVWLAAASRPLVIIKEVFQQPPSDVAWGADGYTLVVSGHDGSVVVLRFTADELGTALPEADRRAHFIKTYGKDAGIPGSLSLALDGAPALVDNPRQLNLERLRKEQLKRPQTSTAAGGGLSGVASQGVGMRAQGTVTARTLQIESRGKSGKRRIKPMLLSNGLAGSGSERAGAAPGSRLDLRQYPSQPPGGATGGGVHSEGFGPEQTKEAVPSARKRPRVGIGGGSSGGAGCNGAVSTVGVRARDAHVVRLKASGTVPLVSPPELMPRRGASGSLVRQISAGGRRRGGTAFRAPPRLRETIARGGDAGPSDEEGEGTGVEVIECTALDEEFRSLPARRYAIVTVTRGGREAWRDYVAGVVSACCGNCRVAAVGMEDGSIHVFDRHGVRSAPPLVIVPPVAYLECSDSPVVPSRHNKSTTAGASARLSASASGDCLMAISGEGDVFVWDLGRMALVIKSSLHPLYRSLAAGLTLQRSSSAALSASTTSRAAGGSGVGSPGGGDGGHSGSAAGGAGKSSGGVSVVRAGVTAEGMPLVILACPGAFGGSLQAFALHQGMGTWIRVADGRFALSDFYSSGPCTSGASRGGVLSALQTGVRVASSPTPAVLLQASRAGTRPAGSSGTTLTAAAIAASGGVRRESLQSAVTRGHLEESLSNTVLFGSSQEFVDVLRAYAGHLAKSAGFGDGRIRALCDKLLLAANTHSQSGGVESTSGGATTMAVAGCEAIEANRRGEILGLRLGNGPSVLGLSKIDLLKDVVLPALSGNRSLQRLVSEYYDTLELSCELLPPPARALAPASITPASRRLENGAPPPLTSSSAGGGSERSQSTSNTSAITPAAGRDGSTRPAPRSNPDAESNIGSSSAIGIATDNDELPLGSVEYGRDRADPDPDRSYKRLQLEEGGNNAAAVDIRRPADSASRGLGVNSLSQDVNDSYAAGCSTDVGDTAQENGRTSADVGSSGGPEGVQKGVSRGNGSMETAGKSGVHAEGGAPSSGDSANAATAMATR